MQQSKVCISFHVTLIIGTLTRKLALLIMLTADWTADNRQSQLLLDKDCDLC